MLPESSQDKPTIILWSNSAGTWDPASWAVRKKRKNQFKIALTILVGLSGELSQIKDIINMDQSSLYLLSKWLVELRYVVSPSSHWMIVKQNWCPILKVVWEVWCDIFLWLNEAVLYNEFGFDLSCSDLFPVVIQHYFTTNQREILVFNLLHTKFIQGLNLYQVRSWKWLSK